VTGSDEWPEPNREGWQEERAKHPKIGGEISQMLRIYNDYSFASFWEFK
jgi:hypothetical protein